MKRELVCGISTDSPTQIWVGNSLLTMEFASIKAVELFYICGIKTMDVILLSLQWKPLKGETFSSVKTRKISTRHLLNKGVWCPVQGGAVLINRNVEREVNYRRYTGFLLRI